MMAVPAPVMVTVALLAPPQLATAELLLLKVTVSEEVDDAVSANGTSPYVLGVRGPKEIT